MKKSILITSLSLLTVALIMMSSNSGVTNSTSGCSCHGYPNANTVITMTGVPSSGYVPGTAYSITLSATNMNYAAIPSAKAGFDLIFSAGTLSNAPAQTTINGLEISHSSGKAMTSGTVSWTFTWTAPASGTGAVTANVALNVTNGNGQTSGDAHNIATINLLQAAPTTLAPTISNVTSSAITTSAATIGANVIANNATTSVSVEYGLTTAYGSTLATTPSSVNGSTSTSVSANLTSLTPNTTYNYRIKAVNSVGTTYSVNNTFQTNSTTSIILLEDNGFIVSPNPSSDGKFVLSKQHQKEISHIEIYNALGSKIALSELSLQNFEFDLSSYASGIYYLSFYVNGRKTIAKLIKN